MMGTPAALLQADALAGEFSYFSIANDLDLPRYVMATDRANARIAALYRTDHPAVMRVIEMNCEAARRAGIGVGIRVGICGEAAAELPLISRFIQMGVSELSMSPALILAARKRISES